MNKNSVQKRFLSLVMAAVMLVGLLPGNLLSAFAADDDPQDAAWASYEDVLAANGGSKTFTMNLTNTISEEDDTGKIYSYRTVPSVTGNNRGTGMYLGYIDPAYKDSSGNYVNEGAGGYVYCYNHTKGAGYPTMEITVNSLVQEDDPLSVLIYYNGYTNSAKESKVQTIIQFSDSLAA